MAYVKETVEQVLAQQYAADLAKLDRREAQWKLNRERLAALKAAGFTEADPDCPSQVLWGVSLDVELTDLTRARLAIGKALKKQSERPLDPSDCKTKANRETVIVTMMIDGDAYYDGVRFAFRRRLPKGAKCKIVVERTSSRRLVCEV